MLPALVLAPMMIRDGGGMGDVEVIHAFHLSTSNLVGSLNLDYFVYISADPINTSLHSHNPSRVAPTHL